MKRVLTILISIITLMSVFGFSVSAEDTPTPTPPPYASHLSETAGNINVLTAGYYAFVIPSSTVFGTIRGQEYIEYATLVEAEADIQYISYAVNAVLPFQYSTDTLLYVYFSQDGVTLTQRFDFPYTAMPEVPVGAVLTPTVSFARKTVTGTELVVTITCSINESLKTGGVSLRNCDLLTSDLEPLSTIKTWTDGSVSDTFDTTITSNGTYWIRVADSNGAYMRISIDVSNISTGIIGPISDPVTDREAPVIVIGSLPSNLTEGTPFSIVVKTNEVCAINLNAVEFPAVSEASFEVTTNGSYLVSAVDLFGNFSSITVVVDGYVVEKFVVKQPDAERDTYWGGVDKSLTNLPQTGLLSWTTLLVGLGITLVGSVVVFVIHRKKSGGTGNETK